MPEHMKEETPNEWVWILRERLERAHNVVRQHIEDAMNRQKKYHDMKMSWEKFKKGDKVFVYFPQRKVGCSPKLTSFWRGPFDVLEQWSDVLYAVACGRKGDKQIIHCDRMRKKREQVLNFECDTPEARDESILKAEETDTFELGETNELDTVQELVEGTE